MHDFSFIRITFIRRGNKGPLVIMTDNCSELPEALSKSWPCAVLLLCVFHLTQQVWRWLFERKHNVSSGDRNSILLLFKKVVYENDVQGMETVYEEMISSNIVSKYPNLVTYFSDLYDIRQAWTISFRSNLLIRANITNNPVEAQFLVLKDEVLNRTKEININGLFDKLTTDFNDHYKVKLLNVASGKFDGWYSNRFKGLTKKKGEGSGFKLPSQEDQEEAAKHITPLSANIFSRALQTMM